MMLFESLIHIIKQIHLSNLYVETKNGKKKTPFPPRGEFQRLKSHGVDGEAEIFWGENTKKNLGGGFKHLLFSSLPGEDSQFD